MDPRQRGAALITALLLLIVITILSLTSMRSSTQELKMASNQEARVSAFQTAAAIVDGTIENPANLVVFGSPGFKNCTANITSGCGRTAISLPNVAPFSDALVESRAAVVMEKPDGAPPRTVGTSIDKFGAATFRIDATGTLFSDTTASKLVRGRSQVGQGFMILVPKSSQTN